MSSKVETLPAVRTHSELATLDELERILLAEERPKFDVLDDPDQISREIVAQLLRAETDEELESVGQAFGWRELKGVPMELHGFSWRPSSFQEGAPVFFVVQATRLDTGDRIVLTTGSMNVLAQLVNMARRRSLVGAVRVLVEADKETSRGFKPLWLKSPPPVREARKAASA